MYKTQTQFCALINCLVLIGFTTLYSDNLYAQSPEPRTGDTVVWYVVVEGDTLKKITEHYLEDGDLWPENHRLNPQLRDPDMLRIGQRLRIISSRKQAKAQAEIKRVERDVKRKQPPQDWEKAETGDKLKEKDAIRTLADSAAQLRFEDGTLLNIREDSLLFLKHVGRNLRGYAREKVEVVEGQVDLDGHLKRPERLDFEMVLGNVTSRPGADKLGNIRTRSRKNPDGNAEVMVFRGNSKVDAAGSSVSVPAGMGTVVREGEAPQPPTRLLPAPKALTPNSKDQLNYANPHFTWAQVPLATSYTLEICGEPKCATPLIRQDTGLVLKTEANLPKGSFYWRVTAKAQTGLDGYPGKTRPLTITSSRPDQNPPTVYAYPVGRGKAVAPNLITLAKGARVRLTAADDASGIDRLEYRFDNGTWQTYRDNLLALPKNKTEAQLRCRAYDKLGRVSEELNIKLALVTKAPEQPRLQKP